MSKLNFEIGNRFLSFFKKMEQIIPSVKIDDDGKLLIGKVRVGQIPIPFMAQNDIFRGLLLEIEESEQIMVFGVKSGPWMYIRLDQEHPINTEFKICSKNQWIIANNYIKANCWAAIEKMIDLGLSIEPMNDSQIKEIKEQLEKVF